MDVDMQLYKIFFTVAKWKSISGAAGELCITQPAVSQAIKQLESQLDSQLFVRNSRGVALTDEGSLLYSYIEKALNLINAAQIRFEELKNLEKGVLSIGASDTICKYFLLPYLEIFHKQYPKIILQVTNRTSGETIELLKSGKVDIGFVNMPIDLKNDITVRKLSEVHDCFVYGKKYFSEFENKTTVELKDLESYEILMLEDQSATRRYIDNFFRKNHVNLKPEIELGSLDLLSEFAKAGLGIAAVIEEFVQEEIRSGMLRKVKLKTEIPPRHIGMVYQKNFPLSYTAKVFMKMISEAIIH